MGKRKHRRSRTSPGFIDGHRGNSLVSEFEESPIQQEEVSELDPQIILRIPNSLQLGVNSVNLTDQGDVPSFSQSSSSRNSSISLILPSSNVSLAEKTGSSFDSSEFEQLTYPISDFSQSQGRVRSSIQFPPSVQAMDRSGEGYDPRRIPAAIFETNTALEWSVASNDSLFSLNLGRTNSLSPEQLFSIGGDMNKSGEFDPMSRVSDVEDDHVLKKIVEYDADEEGITEVREKKNNIRLNQTKDDLKQKISSGEASLRHGDVNIPSVAKVSKKSEESIRSANSFASDQVLADGTKPKHSSSIQMHQHEPEPEKARSKSWFVCCSFSSCFLGSCSSSCLPNK